VVADDECAGGGARDAHEFERLQQRQYVAAAEDETAEDADGYDHPPDDDQHASQPFFLRT